MSDPTPVTVNDSLAKRYAELAAAQEAAASWAKHAKGLKASILEDLGYDPDDDKPPSRAAVDAEGRTLFAVEVTYRKGFDREGLSLKYPAVFAEFETLTPVKSIKPAPSDA